MAKLTLLLAVSCVLSGCTTLMRYNQWLYQNSTPNFMDTTNVYEVDAVEKWGAQAKDVQGQIFEIESFQERYLNGHAYVLRDSLLQFALQRAALVAWEEGYPAFTVLSNNETSSTSTYSYSKEIIPRFGDNTTTTIRDSKGNVIGTASSTPQPQYETVTKQSTSYKRKITVQLLQDEDDAGADNIYLVSKYFRPFILVTGLDKYEDFYTDHVDIILCNNANMENPRNYRGKIRGGFAVCTAADGQDWLEPGQYYIVVRMGLSGYSATTFRKIYWFTNGKTFKQLGITNKMNDEQISMIPTYNISDLPIGLSFDLFSDIDRE